MSALLAKTLHGSRLYRLDGPASDTDRKAIHLPDPKDCLLLRAARNSRAESGAGADKVETEGFALQEWLKLAANGEDVAICMMQADPMVGAQTESSSFIWEEIVAKRKRFYTKRMAGALGFARGMAFKYALRADRMAAVDSVIAALRLAYGLERLRDCWDDLPPDGPYIRRTVSQDNRDALDKRMYEVAGKALPATITPQYALDIMVKLRGSYGERVKAARAMGGHEMKAISHSFRVGYQLLHIYQDGDFSFPLPETEFIRAVKENRVSYIDDKLDQRLDELITQVEGLAAQSQLPERVAQGWLDSIVIDAYRRVYHLDLQP